MVNGARYGSDGAKKRLTLPRVLMATAMVGALAAAPAPSYAKKEKGPLDEVVEKYNQAKIPKKDAPPGPVVLSPDECKSFAKDFVKAGEKEKGREAEGLFNAGSVYDLCGQEKDAEGLYNQALSKNPKFAPAMSNLGVIYQKRGQTQQALAQFEAAIKVDPKSPQAVQAYNNRGAILYERARQGGSKSFDDAIGSIRRALAIDSASMAAYQLLASIYYQTAETDKSKLRLAQLVCDEAKKINPDYAPIYHTLGLIKLSSKDVTGALTEFRKAAALDPSLLEAQMNIGAISLSARSYKQAEEAFQSVIKKQPNNFDATIGMGVALRGQEKPAEAENWYNKALALDPKNCGVLYNLGLLYQDYKSGSPEDLKKGQDLYNKYLTCGRSDPEHQGDAKRRIKDIDDTFKALEEQKKLEAELKAQQAEMERMQKIQEEQAKAAGAAGAPPPAPPPPADGKK